MVIVQLIGGLGNQMFQYAMAKRLAVLKDTLLKFDITLFKNYGDRQYDLGCFNIKENFASQEEICRLRGPYNKKIPWKTFKLINRAKPVHMRSYFKEKQFNFDPEVFKVSGDVYVEGYWQSEKYFKDIKHTIREDLQFKTEPDPANKEMADLILNLNSVSVHIRRGDYVSDPEVKKVHGTCSMDYYNNAVENMLEKIKNPHFFVFSDDPAWVLKNLKINHPITFINKNSGKAFEDLRLISYCRHHIIANSSFSWWGAWLSKNPHKIVIAPKKWFNDPCINTEDLVPESWNKL